MSAGWNVCCSPGWILLLVVAAGCKSENPWQTVYPARGKVTYQGKSVANAEIALFPEDAAAPATVRPRATTSEDGSFAIWTYERGDGAPAGRYKATVVHHEVVISNGAMGVKPNSLPDEYARAETTDLVVEIEQGENVVSTFELK